MLLPMLLTDAPAAIDDPAYSYELKLDALRRSEAGRPGQALFSSPARHNICNRQ